MPHRILKDWERCGMNTFLGAHVWEFSIVREKGEELVSGVACRLCHVEPPTSEAGRFAAEFEQQKRRDSIARGLHIAQKEATGTQIRGKRA